MRVLVDINHPAHVHLFKHFAWEMEAKGHKVFFTTRKKEVTIDLLTQYGFEFESFGNHYKSMWSKMWGFVKFDFMLLRRALKFKPDVFLTMGGMYASHVATMVRKPHIALDDTEHAKEHHMLYVPFTQAILTPVCFHKSFGKNQIYYKGWHELAYLHPNRFTPNPEIYNILGIEPTQSYVIVRFVSWDASHDIGQKGLTMQMKIDFIAEMSKRTKVFISSESELPENLKAYQIKIPPHRMHDALAYAKLFIGEGSTMASECACLGTPAIYINSLEVGYCTEQEKYGLVYNFRRPEGVVEKAIELLETPNLKTKMAAFRLKMLKEKIDVSAFLVWFVENYPNSFKQVQKDTSLIDNFLVENSAVSN
jgi:predicted glycosyltransferase